MLNNLKETMATEETLATLPTATLVAEEKCCDAFEIKPTATTGAITTSVETTTTIITTPTITTTSTETTTTQTKTPTSSPTKGKSIFNWFKSTTNKTNDDTSSTQGDNTATTTTAIGSLKTKKTTTPASSPQRVHQHQTPDTTLVSSYCEFRGVQSLRQLWNKRISAIEATNNSSKSCVFHSTKAKKLHKSVSCLVSATINANESHCCDDNTDDNDAFDTRQTAHVKRRQARTKRAQSLVDCSLIRGEEKQPPELTADEVEINPLHREKDNFYKYKTAEQASKLWQLQTAGVTKRLSAGIVSGNDSCTQKFPAIKTSDKGELIHWLRRDEIEMIARRSDTANKVQAKSKMQGSDELSTASAAIDVISEVQVLQRNGSDTQVAANSAERASIAAISECRTNASSASTYKRSSADSPGFCTTSTSTRVRRNTSSTRKYSFKTHARSYHSPRKMHASKGDKGATAGSASQSCSLVAQLTQQFNALIQKDKSLLEEVKRNNGVLMSRGGHVYKVVPKTELRASPSFSSTNARAKDYTGKALNVRRAIRNFESGLRQPTEKPRVPPKSPYLLRNPEELVAMRNRQIFTAKRPKSSQKLQTSDKVELQLKCEQPRLEIVKEEAKSPLQGDKRSNDEVSTTPNVSSFNESQSTNVSSTTTTSSGVSNNDNKQNVAKTINTVNQAETSQESDNKNKHAESVEDVENEVVEEKNVEIVNEDVANVSSAFINADNTAAANKAKQRLEPEGQAADASNLEQLVSHTDATIATDADVASRAFPTVDSKCDAATAALVNVEKTETVDSDTVDHDVDEEKRKQRKNKYAKIYEKFRFRKPLNTGQNKKLTSTGSTEEIKVVETSEAEFVAVKSEDDMETRTNDIVADAKILDALDVIDQKLKGLTEETDAMVICASGDFEQRVLPNSSFIYQAIAKQVLGDQPTVTQAVNVTLVNIIGGEQILKEEQLVTDASKRQQIKLIEISDISEQVDKPANIPKMNIEPAVNSDSQKCIDDSPRPPPIEDIYEPIAATQSFLYKNLKNKTANDILIPTDSISEDIYQTLEEVNAIRAKSSEAVPAHSKLCPISDDYESIWGSGEKALSPVTTATKTADFYDGYESFEPQDQHEPHHIIAKKSALPTTTATLVRHTTDKLPAIPEPKRKISKSPLVGQKLRPAPPKPNTPPALNAKLPSPPLSTFASSHNQHSPQNLIDDTDDQQYYADDENIYDIIKGSHCYESVQTVTTQKTTQRGSPKSLDTFSLGSNCYESITHYRRVLTTSTIGGAVGCMPLLLHSAGSTSTLSSDHKTNSLYSAAASLTSFGVDATGAVDGGRHSRRRSGSVNSSTGVTLNADVQSNNYSNSNKASSEGNSDDWVDITDTEADNATDATVGAKNIGGAINEQFIVVRERTKVHRSPDWSKRVRDKRLQQKTALSCEDDSDHYYESLSPMNNKRHPTQMVQRSGSRLRRNQDLPRYALRASQRRKSQSAKTTNQGQNVSDDYDSFDTDTDEVYEADENHKNQNDSGVDTRLVKLPDPPSSKNQVYAMVKKLKNFISSKKSPTSSKFFGSQQRIYEDSSQFYIEGNLYQDSPKTKSNSALATSNIQSSRKTPHLQLDNKDYENTEFHNAPTLSSPVGAAITQLSTSDKNLSLDKENTASPEPTTPTTKTVVTPSRSESRSGKSFKSRLRSSLVGSSFDTKQLSTLITTRSKFYIEDPSHSGSGELDSGFSEKTSTGDLTVEVPSVPLVPPKTNSTTPSAESQKFSTATRMAKKEAKAASSQRRRTIIGIRPLEPPPPPPPAANDETYLRSKHSSSGANTSWYAECGVFKNGTSLHAEHTLLHGGVNASTGKRGSQGQLGSTSLNGGSHTSWYAEAGLYQTSDISVASSSGSSGVSTGNEACLSDDVPHSMFLNEPLYQIYSAAKLQSLSHDMEDQGSSSDGYEEIGQHGGAADGQKRNEEPKKHSRPTALQIVGPKNSPSRTLWCEIPEVIQSCILHTLTPRERDLQEAKFEIITSEASYLKSLNLLRNHFMNHPVFRDTNLVSSRDRKALFSHIVPVHECSERLLTALESCWQDNIMLIGLSERIYTIAEKYFHVYIAFCENQGRMDRTLRRLKESRGMFAQNLDLLEASPNCCGLNMQSFLMMPMQRITRLPLLIDAVFSKSSPNDDEYNQWKMTLAIMNKIVTECNEAANRCEQAYEIERIARQLEFPSTIRALAIAPVGVAAPGAKPRFLVKKGELTHLIWRGDDAKLTFGKKFVKTTIFVFLFSDLLVLTKRKGEQQFLVFDYCPRNMLTISPGDSLPQLPTKDINQTGKNLILMTLLENHKRKTVELVISCPSVSEQERWLAAMRPPEAETPGEKLYEQWDCPQVVTTHAYETNEPDALNLEVGDVINVTRKLPDGWYQGERLRDGAIGWFPGNHTEEVNSAHVRARNLKQRYRLLTFTATYLETQKRK